jgi:DNA-binding NarL/FixJ family response regulator
MCIGRCCGPATFVLKNAANLDLCSAITRVASGELLLSMQSSGGPDPKSERVCTLTPREFEILQSIVDGNSNKEIATQLSLSENTVGSHRANMMRKLGIHKTAELVAYAIRKRLVNIP